MDLSQPSSGVQRREELSRLIGTAPDRVLSYGLTPDAQAFLNKVRKEAGDNPAMVIAALDQIRERALRQLQGDSLALSGSGSHRFMLSAGGEILTVRPADQVAITDQYVARYVDRSLEIQKFAKTRIAERFPGLRPSDHVVVLSNSSSLLLAHRIAACLGLVDETTEGLRGQGSSTGFKTFSDGEFKFSLDKRENLRGKTVVIPFAPYGPNQDKQLRELTGMIDVARRMDAKVKVIFFSFPYQRQDGDRQDIGSEKPIEQETLAEICRQIGANGKLNDCVVVDFHPGRGNYFIRELSDTHRFLHGSYVLVPAAREFFDVGGRLNSSNTVVVAPDAGSNGRCRFFAKQWGLDSIEADKIRNPRSGDVEKIIFHGTPKENVFFVDDMIASSGTFRYATEQLKRKASEDGLDPGNMNFYYVATNMIGANRGYEALIASPQTKAILTLNLSMNGNYPVSDNVAALERHKLVAADAAMIGAEVAFRWVRIEAQRAAEGQISIRELNDKTLPADGLPSFLSSCYRENLS